MLNQIRDGNGVKAPRNIIDLCLMAQEEQLRKDRRTTREMAIGQPLIEGDALKKASIRLSKLRIEDTLLAEYGEDVTNLYRSFPGEEIRSHEDTLSTLFHITDRLQTQLVIKILCDIGFLEQVSDEYHVPSFTAPV